MLGIRVESPGEDCYERAIDGQTIRFGPSLLPRRHFLP